MFTYFTYVRGTQLWSCYMCTFATKFLINNLPNTGVRLNLAAVESFCHYHVVISYFDEGAKPPTFNFVKIYFEAQRGHSLVSSRFQGPMVNGHESVIRIGLKMSIK